MIRLYIEVKGIYGYRRMTLNIRSRLRKSYNHKRIYRLMKSVHMRSVIRRKKKRYVVTEPRITAENLLNREFAAETPNQKWLTDITEFKLCNGKKAYLSAILDLADKSIISYVLGHSGNNQLVFDTLDKAIQANPTAHPLFHSDRGLTYTNRQFHTFEELQQAIDEFILFYNTRRLQPKLKGLAPLDFRNQTLAA